ncbi:unnamed protein product [Colias eurytheme]|nr:unnamed protein product [Colias eurytheme]
MFSEARASREQLASTTADCWLTASGQRKAANDKWLALATSWRIAASGPPVSSGWRLAASSTCPVASRQLAARARWLAGSEQHVPGG